jgi:hypothetical protein
MDSDLFSSQLSSDRTQRLHGNHGRNFQGREHNNFGEEGFEQAAQMKTRGRAAEQNRRGLGYLLSRQLAQAIEDAANE